MESPGASYEDQGAEQLMIESGDAMEAAARDASGSAVTEQVALTSRGARILLEALTLVPPYSQESLEAVNLAEDPDIFTVMRRKERLQELREQFQAEKVELNKEQPRGRPRAELASRKQENVFNLTAVNNDEFPEECRARLLREQLLHVEVQASAEEHAAVHAEERAPLRGAPPTPTAGSQPHSTVDEADDDWHEEAGVEDDAECEEGLSVAAANLRYRIPEHWKLYFKEMLQEFRKKTTYLSTGVVVQPPNPFQGTDFEVKRFGLPSIMWCIPHKCADYSVRVFRINRRARTVALMLFVKAM